MELLNYFVDSFVFFYGEAFCVYNMHNLNKLSCNSKLYLKKIKKSIHNARNAIAQKAKIS